MPWPTSPTTAICILDVAFMDAYDGAGRVPAHLATGAFLAALCRTLAPGGVCACNCWNGDAGGGATLKKSSARAADELDAAAEEEEAAAGGGATRKEDDEDTRKEDPPRRRARTTRSSRRFPAGRSFASWRCSVRNPTSSSSRRRRGAAARVDARGGDAEAAARLGEALARAKREAPPRGGEAMRAALCDADRLKVTRPRDDRERRETGTNTNTKV